MVENCEKLNVIQEIVCRLRLRMERSHELSKLISFSLLNYHVRGIEVTTEPITDDKQVSTVLGYLFCIAVHVQTLPTQVFWHGMLRVFDACQCVFTCNLRFVFWE